MKNRTWNRYIGKDYDYYYLLKLEQLKMRRMKRYLAKHGQTVSTPYNVRDLALCDKLISIILEEDPVYNEHLNHVRDKRWEMYAYVNDRNERRFFRDTPIKKNKEEEYPYQGEDGRNDRIVMLKMSLRELKALHLYNLIREYRMFHWWD